MGMDSLAPEATAVPATALPDAEVVKRIRGGERPLFEILMRRHNQRLYRAARAVVKDEHEVEDVLQQAYVNAFTHLDQFEERSQFSTWLMRITLNEAFSRRRKLQQADREEKEGVMETVMSPQPDPEH
jgi:RNA polymerase sigma-70 factor (ECF subfamily)